MSQPNHFRVGSRFVFILLIASANAASACTIPETASLTTMSRHRLNTLFERSGIKKPSLTQMIFDGSSIMDCSKGKFNGYQVDKCVDKQNPSNSRMITSNSIFSKEGHEVSLIGLEESKTRSCLYYDQVQSAYLVLDSRRITWRVSNTTIKLVTIDNALKGFYDSTKLSF